MTISVVTATIAADEALRISLASVAGQSHRDIEHIVVDGSDGGEAQRIVALFDGIKYIRRERRGVYDALNAGLAATTGDIIGLVHGSDRLASPEVLARVAEAFEADPQLDFVYGDLQYVRPGTYAPRRIYHAASFRPGHVVYGMTPPHPTLYMRRRVFEKIGYYSTDYVIGGDIDMWIRLFADTSLRFRYLPMIMVHMPTGGLSTTLRARLYTNNHEKLKALRTNGLPASPVRLAGKYFMVIGSLLRHMLRHK